MRTADIEGPKYEDKVELLVRIMDSRLSFKRKLCCRSAVRLTIVHLLSGVHTPFLLNQLFSDPNVQRKVLEQLNL